VLFLDISAVDGKVTVSVGDQRDGRDHAVEARDPNGTLLGFVTSFGGKLIITPVASNQVLAEQTGKTPDQIAAEFAAFQALVSSYDNAKQFFQNLPDHTDLNTGPKDTQHAQGTDIQPSQGSVQTLPDQPTFGDKVVVREVVITKVTDQTNTGDDSKNKTDTDTNNKTLPDNPDNTVHVTEIFGTPGNDFLIGTSGPDIVLAGPGNDTIEAGDGGGNDFYDGGADFDKLIYPSATTGLIFHLFGIAAENTADDAPGASHIGHDIFTNIEEIDAGSGNDVFILHSADHWRLDGGAGIDTIRLFGALNIPKNTDVEVRHFEIIDLNTTDANSVYVDAGGIAQMNDQHTIRVIGGSNDLITLGASFFGDDFEGLHPSGGHWILHASGVAYTGDHVTDGATFNEYQFVGTIGDSSTPTVLATAHIQQGVSVDLPPEISWSPEQAHTPENTPLHIAGMSFGDVDAAVNEQFTFTVSAHHGSIAPAFNPGLYGLTQVPIQGDNHDNTTPLPYQWSFAGSLEHINAALAASGSGTGFTYAPESHYTGPSDFTFTVTDSHGASDSQTLGISVDGGPPPNQPPQITISQPAPTLVEAGTNGPGVDTAQANVSVSDPDSLDHYVLGNGWTPVAPSLAGAQQYNGHYYAFVPFSQGTVSWTDAQNTARAMGGDLAAINSSGENDFIRTSVVAGNIQDGSTAAYLGGSNIGDGSWHWSSGLEGTPYFWNGSSSSYGQYTNWRTSTGEPNNPDTEHFLVMEGDGTWNNASSPDAVYGTPGYSNAVGYVVEFANYRMDGTYGYAIFNTASGTITYHLNNDDPDTQALGANDHVTDDFQIAVSDGNTTTFKTVSFAIDGANDAGAGNSKPVLDESATPVLKSVGENANAPTGAVGTLISDLVDLNPPIGGLDNVTDTAGAVTGIAIYGTHTAGGTLFYTIDGGVNWLAVGTVSDTQALLLAANADTRLYFQPGADFTGTIDNIITFRAWDQTEGSNGEKFDIGIGGNNTSAVSSAPDGASITVNAVEPSNNPPVANNDTVDTTEDAATIDIHVAQNDSDDSGGTLYAMDGNGGTNFVLSNPSLGTLHYTSFGDFTFTPAANASGTTTFTYQAFDGELYSNTATVTINVAAVNDAPQFASLGPTAVGIEQTFTILDSNVTISDVELDAAGNYNGASLVIARQGGADSQDEFSFNFAGTGYSVNGNTISFAAIPFATFTNSGGTLTVNFGGSQVFHSTVNDVMQHITYKNTSDAPPGSVQLDWTFNDGNSGAQGSGGQGTTTLTLTVNIASVNDAPVIAPDSSASLTTIAENDTNNAGQTVASFLTGVSDPDANALQGIAITSADNGNGEGYWQYRLAGSDAWNGLSPSSLSDNAALLLKSGDYVRFVPISQGAGSLTYHAWDQTSGTAGGTANLAAGTGGQTAFSNTVETATIDVTSSPPGNPEPVQFIVRTPDGYDITTLYGDINGAQVTEIDSTHILAVNSATGHTILVDTQGLQFDGAPGGGDITLLGGTITGFHISTLSGTLVDITGYNIPAPDFGHALDLLGLNDTSGLDAIFRSYAYNTTGGPGADVLAGGNLADLIDMGGGADHVQAGGGNDVILVHDASPWSVDGGAGIDTIRAVGGADFNGEPGPQAQNFEIIDLNTTDPDKVQFDAQGIASFNADHTIRILGSSQDVVSVQNGFNFHPDGHWSLAASGVNYTQDDVTLNIEFDKYIFSDNAETLATIYVQQGIIFSPPEIVTDHQSVVQNGNGTATLFGLSVSDADNDPLTITATALHGTVSPSAGSGSVAQVNDVLANGVTYTPIPTIPGNPGSLPANDKVTVTVTDADGGTDAVNFIFNVAGAGPNITLTGTSGKDVIYATGYHDTLTGGAGADTFVFKANSGNDVITDFTVSGASTHDRIDVRDFTAFKNYLFDLTDGGTPPPVDLIRQDLAHPANTIIDLDATTHVTLQNVDAAQLKLLADSHFIFQAA
jgi:VCBS repeat-containing protein